ncbi:MAG: hypothetical protein Q4D03_09435 [Bacteroidales bacterium]|nr:hypothetical protein [Bacteroidales bacterium]
MKKLFLFGAMVCTIGMMTACKSGAADNTAADTMQPCEPSSVFVTNEYHFKDLKTPNSLQVVYIKYHPNLEKDSIDMGDDRFVVYDDRAYYFSGAVETLESKGVKYDVVDYGTVFYNGEQQVIFLTEVGDIFIFVETADDGSNYIKFTCNPIDICSEDVYADDKGVWHNQTDDACDWVEPI